MIFSIATSDTPAPGVTFLHFLKKGVHGNSATELDSHLQELEMRVRLLSAVSEIMLQVTSWEQAESPPSMVSEAVYMVSPEN